MTDEADLGVSKCTRRLEVSYGEKHQAAGVPGDTAAPKF